MSNVDINVDGRTDGQKIGRLYRTLLQAGAIKIMYTPLRPYFSLYKVWFTDGFVYNMSILD